jgi:hypothetical protein
VEGGLDFGVILRAASNINNAAETKNTPLDPSPKHYFLRRGWCLQMTRALMMEMSIGICARACSH